MELLSVKGVFGYRMETHRLEMPQVQGEDMQDGGWTFPRHQRKARRRQRSLSMNRVVQQAQRNPGELPTDRHKVQRDNSETLGESSVSGGLGVGRRRGIGRDGVARV